jgi:LEA14-like dessication related protein
MKRVIGIGFLALLLGACSTFLPRLETPTLSIVNVEMVGGGVWEQNMKVRMRVQNPNDRTLPVHGLTYTLEVAGQELAEGVSDKSFVVPALGETEFDMNVRTNMALALLRLAGDSGKSLADSIDYRIHGKVSLSEGWLRSIPFEESGTFQLK